MNPFLEVSGVMRSGPAALHFFGRARANSSRDRWRGLKSNIVCGMADMSGKMCRRSEMFAGLDACISASSEGHEDQRSSTLMGVHFLDLAGPLLNLFMPM